MTHEFNKEDEIVIAGVAQNGFIIAVLIALGGILFILRKIIDDSVSQQIRFVYILQGMIQVVIGLLFIPASLSFKRIVQTKGNDINELMDGINRMASAFFLIIGLILVNVLSDVLLIFLED